MSRFEFTLELFLWLLSKPGQHLLAIAQQLDLRPEQQLKTLALLRQQAVNMSATREQSVAAYEMATLRRHARSKFTQAGQMYFTREALEQASGERISTYRFARLAASQRVYDLGCSVGGDLLTLATMPSRQVVGVDRNPVRLAMAVANAEALGLSKQVDWVEADLEQFDPAPCDGIFFDPARRDQGRRLGPAAYLPSLQNIVRWLPHTHSMAVKVAPGIQRPQVPLPVECESEFISVDGELKEAVLWYGEVAQPGQRATLIQGNVVHTLHRANALDRLPISPPCAFLYEPDGAILRAYLVELIGAQLNAAQLDPDIAYLTSDEQMVTPFARCWRVVEWMPFQLKNLRTALRARSVGAVTVKKRGSPIDTDQLARELSGDGDWPCVVVLTQHLGRPIAIVAEGPI